MLIDVVEIPTRDGLQLPCGLFETQASRSKVVDAVIMNPGTAGSFYHPTMREIASTICARGYTVLTMSTRGHDIVWRDQVGTRYLGYAYERISDCRNDFEGAVEWLARRGYSRIALYGHSLGAVKALYYASQDPDVRVAALVAASAPRWSADHYDKSERGDDFRRNRDLAESLVASGRADDLFEMDFPQGPILMTAAGYLDKYGGETFNFSSWASNISLPLLWLEGEKEADFFPLKGNRQEILGVAASPIKDAVIIPGADHFYAGRYAEVGAAVADWLDRLPGIRPG